eukprot:EC122189.1.p2 GENE.EC122189.1~~EC122189.1.p2  ORF type:complete len:140 (+),score=20.77 EC122189.1:113-532(+)
MASGCKLFVGGLSWNTTDDSLRNAFEAFGEVTDAKVITDYETGRSRGFGFVTYASPDQASTARSEMNDRELEGRVIRVDAASEGGGGAVAVVDTVAAAAVAVVEVATAAAATAVVVATAVVATTAPAAVVTAGKPLPRR